MGHGEEYGPVGYGDPTDSSHSESVLEKIDREGVSKSR